MSTWPCYRVVLERFCTWTEVTTTMSIDDVDRLCIAAATWFAHNPSSSEE